MSRTLLVVLAADSPLRSEPITHSATNLLPQNIVDYLLQNTNIHQLQLRGQKGDAVLYRARQQRDPGAGLKILWIGRQPYFAGRTLSRVSTPSLRSKVTSVDSCFDVDDSDENSSEITQSTENELVSGVDTLADVLRNDPLLHQLYPTMLEDLGEQAFKTCLTGLLCGFSKDLSGETRDVFEEAAARSMQSAATIKRIINRIMRPAPGDVDRDDNSIDKIAMPSHKQIHLEEWLDDVEEGEYGTDQHLPSSPDEESEDTENEDVELDTAQVAQVEQFVAKSAALHKFKQQVLLAILPERLAQPLTHITEPEIWLSSQQHLSPLNRLKACVEDYSGRTWQWWPLEPRRRWLQNGEARMIWSCVSVCL